jgi:transposase InsO family protein
MNMDRLVPIVGAQRSAQRKRWLMPYTHYYNHHREHSSLGYNPPISRLDRNNVLTRNS